MLLFTIVIAGLISTVLMCVVLETTTRLKLANADMIRALGSLFTGKFDNSMKPGLIFMLLSGVFFGFVYYAIINFFVPSPGIATVLAGLAMGLFHGMVVSLALVVIVAEHHPLERFRKAGFQVAAAHLGAHVIYGFSVGTLVYFGTLL